jgi:hypothetical protein
MSTAIAERLTHGWSLARRTGAGFAWAAKRYWAWITALLDPIGAAYGTAMVVGSILFLIYTSLH